MDDNEGEQRHIRLAHFLANGCTKLARALVEKHVELSKPREHKPVDKPWSLDNFLYENMATLSKGCNPKQQKLLFPGYQKDSEIQEWDLALLCLVITTCTDSNMVRGDIQQLKNIRNQIYHAGNTDLAREVFDRIVEILDCVVERCCEFIDKPVFTRTMEELLANFKRGNVLVTDRDYEAIRQWYENDPILTLPCTVDELSTDNQLQFMELEEKIALLDKLTGQPGFNEMALHFTSLGMEWDDDLLKAYFKALEKGHESAHHARFMVIGMYNAGKTTLVSKLLEKPEPPPNSSTVFIDISVDTREVDGNGKWKETTFAEKEKGYSVRLKNLFKLNIEKDETNAEMKISDRGISEQVNQGVHMEETNGAQGAEESFNKHGENIKRFKKERYYPTLYNTDKYYKDIKEAADSSKKHADLEKRPTVSIWDFAGQSVYYSTHQFFLNPRTIYLLVLDLSKQLHEKVDEGEGAEAATNLYIGNNTATDFTQLDAFHFWMRSIYIYTKQKDTQTAYTPTIVLVGTHKDACGYKGKEADIFAEKYFEKALEAFYETPIMNLIYKKKFFVSKKESPDVFDSLRAELNKIAAKEGFWKELIPAKFIPLEMAVERQKSNGAKILQFNELVTVSTNSHYPLTKEEIRVFLGFQHAFGNILYYHKADPDTIILHPEWIINALKIFVTHRNRLQSEEWTQFTKMGKLSETLINELLQAEGDYWVPFKEKIIRYMENLDIIAKPVEDTQCSQETQVPQGANVWSNADFYLMPLRFPRRPSTYEIKEMLGWTCENKWISSPVLCMYIKGAFLPPFVFHRIIATCIKDMRVVKYYEEHALYNGFGAFLYVYDETAILTTWSWDNMIYVKVTSYHDERHYDDRMSRRETVNLQNVRMYFEKLVKHAFGTDVSCHGEKIEITHYVTCPRCPEHFPFDRKTDKKGFPIDQKSGLLLVKNLLILRETDKKTLCNPAKHLVDAFEASRNWFCHDTNTCVDPRLTESAFDERFLADLSEKIEIRNHYLLASNLNITDRELECIRNDHGKFARNVTFHILYTWKKRHESLAILLPAVEAAGCKEEDFYRILDGTDDDQTKTTFDRITQKLSTAKLEQIELDVKECLDIADYIGLEYWLLGIRLGLKDSNIQRMHTGLDTTTIVKDILLKWRRQSKGHTNREINIELIKAMVKSSCDMSGVIEIFGRD